VTLNDIAITNKDPKDTILTMEAVAKTFRYLDDEEVSKQRKAKDAQKAPK
jgi:type IV pilus assembly protein PilO